MSLFDSIISEAGERFGLGNKSGNLLAALLGLMTDQNRGGFAGFLDLFRSAGLSDSVSGWIDSGANSELSNEQVESALGEDTIKKIAGEANIGQEKATSALGFMIPNVIDRLTPDGSVPDEKDLLSRIGDFLSGIGGAVTGAALGAAGAVGAMASGTADKVGDAADATFDTGKRAAGAVGNTVGGAFNRVGDAVEDVTDSGSSMIKWLIPLILLLLLLALGWMFCGKTSPTVITNANANSNANKAVSNTNTNAAAKVGDSNVTLTAKGGRYTLTGTVSDQATKDKILAEAETVWGKGNVNVEGLKVDTTAKPFAAGWFDGFKNLLGGLKDWKDGSISWVGNAIENATNIPKDILAKIGGWFTGWTLPASITGAATDSVRKLTEVSLPSGTKLEAYPGGIEDQLIKFIQSDDYKNGTAESLKDKWFSFDDLNFKFGTTELVPESKRQLDNIVAILKAFPDVKIKIGGYTDKKGDDAANKKLSDGRAKAVKATLDKAGVAAQVPEAEGYGEEFAKVPETASDKEREADRKTSVRLLK